VRFRTLAGRRQLVKVEATLVRVAQQSYGALALLRAPEQYAKRWVLA
jgi:hypothetical protein